MKGYIWSGPAQAALARQLRAGFAKKSLPYHAAAADFIFGGHDAVAARKIIMELGFRGGEEPAVAGVCHFGAQCQGPPGYAHGGALATVADMTIGLLPYWSKQVQRFSARDNSFRSITP